MEKEKMLFVTSNPTFLHDIIEKLRNQYEIKLLVIDRLNDLSKVKILDMCEWADIIWCEWADQIAAFVTHNVNDKRIIVRLHGYEIFSRIFLDVDWKNVNDLIFVARHKADLFKAVVPKEQRPKNLWVVRNGINLDKFTIPKDKKKNKNLTIVGYVNYRKGFPVLIQAFKQLVDIDPEYKLYIRGESQDDRLSLYLNHIIPKLGLNKNIYLVKRVDDLNEFFKSMTYIVSSSIEESFHYTIGEGMAAGLKPIVHGWPESEEIWPKENIWYSIKDFIRLVTEEEYNPKKYREYILQNLSLEYQVGCIKDILLRGKHNG